MLSILTAVIDMQKTWSQIHTSPCNLNTVHQQHIDKPLLKPLSQKLEPVRARDLNIVRPWLSQPIAGVHIQDPMPDPALFVWNCSFATSCIQPGAVCSISTLLLLQGNTALQPRLRLQLRQLARIDWLAQLWMPLKIWPGYYAWLQCPLLLLCSLHLALLQHPESKCLPLWRKG